MNPPRTVPEDAAVQVTATGDIVHRCPHQNETDHGTITATWTCAGHTVELHSLRGYLDGFQDAPLSHEAVTGRILRDLSGLDGITDVTVTTSWNTARLTVAVTK